VGQIDLGGNSMTSFTAEGASSTFQHYDVPDLSFEGVRAGRTYYSPASPLRAAAAAGSASIALAGAVLGLHWIFANPHEYLLGSMSLVVGIGLGLGAYFLAVFFISKSQSGDELVGPHGLRASATARREDSDERTLNQRMLAQYHDVTKRQASSSYRVSQFSILVGFTILVSGAYLVINAADTASSQIVVGGLASLGALFSSYIGATFIRMYSQALAQMNFYYAQPLVQSYILEAERISKGFKDPVHRDQVLGQIIEQTLRGADVAAQLTRRDDAATQRPRRATKVEQPVTAPSEVEVHSEAGA